MCKKIPGDFKHKERTKEHQLQKDTFKVISFANDFKMGKPDCLLREGTSVVKLKGSQ
jgi:hypothetical protein